MCGSEVCGVMTCTKWALSLLFLRGLVFGVFGS